MGRSQRLRGRALVFSALPLIAFIAYVLNSFTSWGDRHTLTTIAFYGLLCGIVVYFMLSGMRWRSYQHLPVAPGRVLVLVPAYNEEPELLRNTVQALLRQTRPPDAIHVMDDGSAVPVAFFYHPLVTWHRQENQGKRHAQVNVLTLFDPDDFDYVLTVDSDSVADRDALEHMLRAMSDPEVQACTGMLLVRNWADNLLTRLVDINVVSSCLMARMARSSLGAVCPTSGALALYRAEIIYDNLADYTASGTVGDDRRLSLYALLRGKVVAVNEAVVETALPTTWKGTFRQRMRWSQSAWLAAPFVITNVRVIPLLFYLYPLAFALLWPFVFVALAVMLVVYGQAVLVYALVFWVVVSACQTGVYVAYRPGFSVADKAVMWSLSLLLPLLGFAVLRPACYWALTKCRGKAQAWGTRELSDEFYKTSEV